MFGHRHNRINHKHEIKIHAKNAKVIHLDSRKRLSSLFTVIFLKKKSERRETFLRSDAQYQARHAILLVKNFVQIAK